jgi:hypothetical protein
MGAGDRSEIKHTPDITEKNIISLRTKVKDCVAGGLNLLRQLSWEFSYRSAERDVGSCGNRQVKRSLEVL